MCQLHASNRANTYTFSDARTSFRNKDASVGVVTVPLARSMLWIEKSLYNYVYKNRGI